MEAEQARDLARILVVEDEAIIGRDICKTLSELGYAVTGPALSASEALNIVAREPTDMVLMDIKIQGDMDGIQAAQVFRDRFHLPVIYITAHTDSSTLNRAKDSDPAGYVVKPFTTDDIKVAVELGLERHRQKRQIEERESWLNAVLRSIGEAVIVTDGSDRVVLLNSSAEDLLAVTGNEVTGKPLDDLLILVEENALVSRMPADFDSAAPARQSRFMTGLIRRYNGLERPIVATVTSIYAAAANIKQGSAILVRDVSDLRKTQEALRDTNRFLSRSNEHLTALAHSLAHDLKEPLRMVTCYSKLLAREAGDSLTSQEHEYLETIAEAGRRMEQMLSSLVDYYRAEMAGSAPLTRVDSARVLGEAIENLKAAIEESGALIETEALPEVYAHPTALMQLFQNLIGNAIKFRKPAVKPAVKVSVSRRERLWQFSVADNGIGFDPSEADHLFALFSRAPNAAQPGSGIGLATCRRLVEQYGGRIWSESTPGEGSQFHFTLPAAPAQ